MEPSPSIPYNLRSRGSVVGNRLLRLRRGVPVENHLRSRLKPRKPSVNKARKPCGPSRHRVIDEELREHRQYRLWRMEKHVPYPLVAMQHYNKYLREEEQYKVYDSKGGIMLFYAKVGTFHLEYFTAVPKSFENMPNSSDVVPVKHFYARVHEAPIRQTHVDCCVQGPPVHGSSYSIMRVVPLSCQICGLANEHAIKSKSSELSNQVNAAREYESESDYWNGYSEPDDAPKNEKQNRGALA
ncbi:hypothetical protein PIB30_010644 [Stylosanthes scabra]|uniref:Uncharacterized protein n=1 Tax=Stylosanthes scabra TaxID=79078 RepID=A0ABU6V819_9FABA|nr:hypothetical protein [Stylosanthes scabra]